jgi:hypothetical protein
MIRSPGYPGDSFEIHGSLIEIGCPFFDRMMSAIDGAIFDPDYYSLYGYVRIIIRVEELCQAFVLHNMQMKDFSDFRKMFIVEESIYKDRQY